MIILLKRNAERSKVDDLIRHIHTMNVQTQEIPGVQEYIIALINEFAKRFKLTDVQAYRYITHYKGIDMIDEHYNIMHTLDFDEMVNSLAIYCNRQGGALI